MSSIGIVLAGGMSKGAYELGCLQAISDHFCQKEIGYISASSIGTIVGYAYACGKLDDLIDEWKKIDIKSSGRFFPAFSGNADFIEKIREMITDSDQMFCKMYGSVWNYSQRKIEYVPFHKLSVRERQNYMCAATALPLFNKGVRINNCTLFDGAFIDNIPVYPLLEKNIDYIFCIYFDGKNYLFENELFDRKIIKLYEFPIGKRFENITFDPNKIDEMISYGYQYTSDVIEKIFSTTKKSAIYKKIKKREEKIAQKENLRLTGDVLLTNLNKMTSRYLEKRIL